MEKTIDEMFGFLEQNIISLPNDTQKPDPGNKIEDRERCHYLKAGFSQSQAFLIDYGASNHMASSKESFSSLDLSDGPSIHMGYDSQIPVVGKCLIKFKHGVFKNVFDIPSLVKNLLSVYTK